MAFISHTVKDILNGISQMPTAKRASSQSADQQNVADNPATGKGKRPSTYFLKDVGAYSAPNPKTHLIDRNVNGRYRVLAGNGSLQVFDLLTGTLQTVSTPNGLGYLTSGNPVQDFVLHTVQDYTFILNRNIVPQAAVQPYLTTDQVQATIFFGDGQLFSGTAMPTPSSSQFDVWYSSPFTSQADPFGWASPSAPGPYTTFTQALSALNADLQNNLPGCETLTADMFEVIVADKVPAPVPYSNPATDQTPESINTPNIGIMLKGGGTALHYTSNGTAATFNIRVYIAFTNSSAATESQLYSFVGYPNTPFAIPGGPAPETYGYFPGTGTVAVMVNGQTFQTAFNSDWTFDMYAGWFGQQIQAAFPTYSVTANGYQLKIVAPAGQSLWTSAGDTTGLDLVTVAYEGMSYPDAIFVVIKSGQPDTTYSVSLNGHQVSFTTGDVTVTTGPSAYTPANIATQLAAQVATLTGFSVATYGNIVRISRSDEADVTFNVSDTFDDGAMYAMKNGVQDYTDLPNQFIPGNPIEIYGTSGLGGYYVHWVNGATSQLNASGLDAQVNQPFIENVVAPAGATWTANEGNQAGIFQECAKPGIPSVIIPSTMPHVLIRNADGTFTFREVNWWQRMCGDEDSAPAPSFIGKGINNLGFFKDRLMFLTDGTFLGSRTNQFLNFWPTTVTQVLATDPIDEPVSHTSEAILHSFAVLNTQTSQLLVMSDDRQFAVTSGGLLTPNDVTIAPATHYLCSRFCQPISAGPNVYFVAEQGASQGASKHTRLFEYYLRPFQVQNLATDDTANVPKLIPSTTRKIDYSLTEDTMIAQTDGDPNALYAYKVTWKADAQSMMFAGYGGGQKSQESWGRWSYPCQVLGADFIDSDLYLVLTDGTRVFLAVSRLHAFYTEPDLPFEVLVDQKVSLTGTYTAASNTTQWTLPYATTQTIQAVAGGAFGSLTGANIQGITTTVAGLTTIVTAPGNWSAGACYLGIQYSMSWTLSRLYPRDNQDNTIENASLIVRSIAFNHSNTMGYNVVISPLGRDTETLTYSPLTVGDNLMDSSGPLAEDNDGFLFDVLADSKEVTIEVVNDTPLPSNFTSFTYEATFTIPRGSRRM